MKYYIRYVEGCMPQEKVYELYEEAQEFINRWMDKYGTLDDKGDNWIECIFYGEKLKLDVSPRLERPKT